MCQMKGGVKAAKVESVPTDIYTISGDAARNRSRLIIRQTASEAAWSG